ncbi:MAG: SusD/RagB family nutrient-binding outer membrane lipoprotein [Thermaurantimonas sp.]|uniref:SusD/RagB family nutrient-binding outer membrane lipoprotein n=1 Tax=Thermaurantimonas sp. TaxID=2681568 RepID=UPI00391DB193
MKKLNLLLTSLLAVGLTVSCSKKWLEDYTEDPTRPSDVSVRVLLPSAQVSYAMAQGDVLPRMTCLFIQQMTGTDRQSLAHQRYAQIGEGDFDQTWGPNGYSGGMKDLSIIIEKTEGSSPNYSGVAKVMMAMYLGLFTDVWGDIPYSEAFKGADNLNPRYDSQQQIYATIQTLLDEAIAELQNPVSPLKPGTEDLVFGGNLTRWIKTAYSLKARYTLHLSKKPGFNASTVISLANQGISANADNAQMVFAGPPNTNPWFQFNTQRLAYITQTGTMYNMMKAKNDPRIPLYRSADSATMPFYGGQTSPLPFITNHETKFIIAEAKFRAGTFTRQDLVDAVEANMTYLGVASADRTTYINNLPANPTLADIMYEKYVAMFSHIEAWTDWRRTDLPALTPVSGANLPAIPRRLPYPESERLYNDNFINLTGNDAFLKRHWWDE